MDDVKHKELQVIRSHYDKDKRFHIDSTQETERGHVMISEHDAAEMNAHVEDTRLIYEKDSDEKDVDSMKKDELVKYISDNDLDIDVNQNKGELINAIKELEK